MNLQREKRRFTKAEHHEEKRRKCIIKKDNEESILRRRHWTEGVALCNSLYEIVRTTTWTFCVCHQCRIMSGRPHKAWELLLQATREDRGKEVSPTAWLHHRRWPSFSSCFAFCLRTYCLRRVSCEEEGRKEGRKGGWGVRPSFTQKMITGIIFNNNKTAHRSAWLTRARALHTFNPSKAATTENTSLIETGKEQHLPELGWSSTYRNWTKSSSFTGWSRIHIILRYLPRMMMATKYETYKDETVMITTIYMRNDACTFQKTHTRFDRNFTTSLRGLLCTLRRLFPLLILLPLAKRPQFPPRIFQWHATTTWRGPITIKKKANQRGKTLLTRKN